MAKVDSPYAGLPARSFWSTAVRDRHFCDLEEISAPIRLFPRDRIATAGSCFAQHIGRHLKASGADYMDLEPRPSFIDAADAKRFGYETYSCRYGNVYTSRQLLQLAQEALGMRTPVEPVWVRDGRCFDALRPSVDPAGHDSAEQVLQVRQAHLAAVSRMLRTLDVFVFTLGLTEVWLHREDGTAYPTAAGTIAGTHDPAKYAFVNLRYNDVADDMRAFRELLRSVNPDARMLLTVSPVPLAATASQDHVLVATTRSKAILRAVAGDLAEDHDDVFYFPSYELISSHPGRGMFFEPDLRNVNDAGVRMVMGHFFGSFDSTPVEIADNEDLVCEEGALDQFSGDGREQAAGRTGTAASRVVGTGAAASSALASVASAPDGPVDEDFTGDEDIDEDRDEDRDGGEAAPAPAPVMTPPPVRKLATMPAAARLPQAAAVPTPVVDREASAAGRLKAQALKRKEQVSALRLALRGVKRELELQKKELAQARRLTAAAAEQAERSRQTLSFQLGAVLLEGTKSVGSFAQLPARLLALRREARRRRMAAPGPAGGRKREDVTGT